MARLNAQAIRRYFTFASDLLNDLTHGVTPVKAKRPNPKLINQHKRLAMGIPTKTGGKK